MELLGTTYSQQGSTDQAERCWRQAERWDPNNADVCLDLGRLAMSRRHWDEAVDFLKRAADRSPEAVEPLYNLSQVYRMLGNHDEAERYRRLADQRRKSQPPRRGGMGEDADPGDPTDRRAAPRAGARAMTLRRPVTPQRRASASSSRRSSAPARSSWCGRGSTAAPSLDGLAPLLNARRLDRGRRADSAPTSGCTPIASRPTC